MRHRLESFICEACLVNPLYCSVPRVEVGISWLSIGYGDNVTVVPWTSSHILYGLLLYQKGDVSKATC